MAINSTRGICSTFSTTVDHRGSNSRSGHRVRQNERRATGLSCDAKLQIAIKRQNNKKVVVLCHGSVSQRGVAAALRSRRATARLLHYEAGQGGRICRKYASLPRAGRELDPGTPRHLPPGAVPSAGSARSSALVALVAEPEGRGRWCL